MEVDETNGQGSLSEVSLADGTTCTVDAKDIEENGAALAFASGFSPDQVSSLAELGTGVKRKRDDETDYHTRKLPHSDSQEPESFAEEALANISTTVSIPISQDVTSQTLTTCTSTTDDAHQLAPLAQEAATATLSLSAAVAALQAGAQLTPESAIIPVTQPISVGDNNNSVNQAWFTTKEDKDNLHGKGVKWRQGMWSKEENYQLKSNIMEYCKVNNIADPNIIIFEMTKDDRKDFYRTIAKGIRRPLFAIYRRVLRMYDRRNYIGKYSPEEVEQLKALKDKHGNDWATIGAAMGRSASSVKDRFRLLREHCHSGKWTAEEEQQLSSAVHELTSDASKEGNVTAGISWAAVAERVGTRSEKQCRSKWLNYLNWKEKGGREWTKQDEVQLITRIHEMNFHDENEIDWQVMSANWPSVRSPQWLRSKWWALKKHVPETNTISFQDLVSYLYNTFIEMLQNKIERQEARFRSTHIPRASMVSTCGRPVHVTSLSNGPISSSGIAQTITVSSDGTITRDDDTSQLTTSHSRFEVVQVTALTSQDIYNNQSTVQGTPSYIIQAPAGQTYIIQQPSGHLVRQTHTNELTAASNGLENNLQDQEAVMTAAVLQAHHAVQTLPEVGPEFTQAIVQTDISGPITASDLSTAGLDQTLHDAELHGSEDLPPAVEHGTLDSVTAVTSTRLESHVALPATLSQSELQLVQSSGLKEGSDMSASSVGSSAVGTQFDETEKTTNGTEHSNSAAQTYTSPPFQGPAAIAQTLDGTHLPDRVSSDLQQQINQTTADPHNTVLVSSEHLEDVTVISSLNTRSSPSSACTIAISHATMNNNNSDLSVNAIVPQVTLPDQILQSQSDEPSVMSLTSDTGVMMVSENSLSVATALPSQILHSYESSTLSPSPVPRSMAASSSLSKSVTVTSGLEHTENIIEASDVLLHIADLSIPVMTVSGASGASQHEDIATVIAPQHEDIATVVALQHEDNATVVTSQHEDNTTMVAQQHENIASVVALQHEGNATVVASLHEDIDAEVEQQESSACT